MIEHLETIRTALQTRYLIVLKSAPDLRDESMEKIELELDAIDAALRAVQEMQQQPVAQQEEFRIAPSSEGTATDWRTGDGWVGSKRNSQGDNDATQ